LARAPCRSASTSRRQWSRRDAPASRIGASRSLTCWISRASAEDDFDVVLFSFNGIDTVGGEVVRQRAFAEIRRVCTSGMLRHYHVRPDVQLAQLQTLGFPEVEVYGMQGERVPEEDLARVRSDWLHYLCRST
jgi:hypothetical protein